MNSEFEQKLLELKHELETQRLQQVGTMKSVLERQHSKDIVDLDDVHHQQMDGLRDGKELHGVPKFMKRLGPNLHFVQTGSYAILYPESSGSLASGWSPGETLENSKKNNFLIGCPVKACIVLPRKSCGNKIPVSPTCLLATNRWPKSLRTLGTRLDHMRK